MTQSNQCVPPGSDEIEISIFGPGYGESIVVHFGDGKWALVDSCIEPSSKIPAPLKYLSDLAVNIQEDVSVVIATHWHNDHIRGFSKIVEQCKSATLVISGALRKDEFLKLVSLYSKSQALKNPPLDEFSKIFELLETRKRKGERFVAPTLAVANRLIYRCQINISGQDFNVQVYSLSPSDSSIIQAQLAFSELLPTEDNRFRWFAPPEPNHTSVVLWVEIGKHRILLGADLERTNDPSTGWSVILDASSVISEKADVFKIPHHGSENGHHEGVWTELLLDQPIAVLTPFSTGKKPLPSEDDVVRIVSLTPYSYITSKTKNQQAQFQNKIVKTTLEQTTRNVQTVNNGWGQIRLRRKLDEEEQQWRVELFGNAVQLQK